MNEETATLPELVEYWRNQAAYWKTRALTAEHKTGAKPATPETDTHRRISYTDRTGDTAAHHADKTRRKHAHHK
ncbi:hypothetical protein [Arthrobacter sp. SDTb3-6]|uniref:hypothetical protein n=1 Tax=Arthrobacter sp. SDTb3-6 TaxID=2713571 RepID=UPI00159D2542|nr:hypothetical protein [Arthrobacter sp. SDTb3-6]NVM97681.1 hypothetical protein [Arthrobacter sp. SDTb3-6]